MTAVETGHYYSMALRSNGTVWMWGWNKFGTLGDGTTTNRATPVQVHGLANVIAIRSAPVRVPGLTGAFGLGGGVNYSVVVHT